MKHYEEPRLNVIRYELENNVMEGYKDGDVMENPWADLFTTESSSVGDD